MKRFSSDRETKCVPSSRLNETILKSNMRIRACVCRHLIPILRFTLLRTIFENKLNHTTTRSYTYTSEAYALDFTIKLKTRQCFLSFFLSFFSFSSKLVYNRRTVLLLQTNRILCHNFVQFAAIRACG